jgi:phosphoribosylaminoimidazolecarboxamide formyltransferase/IMP cyclohydrolase
LGGRVKTLHPKIFGGILARRNNELDRQDIAKYDIPQIDLVIVDLYPFEDTLASGAKEDDVIEKIDIGGISLIRATAKNFKDTLVISSKGQYSELVAILNKNEGETTESERKKFAMEAFNVSSAYDTAIFNYFNSDIQKPVFKENFSNGIQLRYGENPHQKGYYYGDFNKLFNQIHGKQISYNNLLDIDAAVNLISDFDDTTFAILKHNNACGLASRDTLIEAWKDALAGDPVSAFGGILICNTQLNESTAEEIDKLFFEVIIAPDYEKNALEILKKKKKRIILIQKNTKFPQSQFKSLLNGAIVQDKDIEVEDISDLRTVTKRNLSNTEIGDLLFANKIVKHSKSNAIVLAKNKQLCASGVGQTSRIDALEQAIDKAKKFNIDLKDAVMASDAFFPFADSVEIANKAGISALIQPGGSIRDKDSIEYCDKKNMAMAITGTRHFKH